AAVADRERHVVERNVGRELRVQPDLLLGEGQRRRRAIGTAGNAGERGGRRPVAGRAADAHAVVAARAAGGGSHYGAPPRVTGSASSPRKPSGPGSSSMRSNRLTSAASATCPSMRASGAPKQKCAPQPNDRWRLSAR